MRAAVFGRQLILVDGEFVGCNVGYNFFSEHENGAVDCLVERLNRNTCIWINNEIKPGLLHDRNVRKKLKSDKLLADVWKDTPFKNSMLMASMPFVKREITIDNDVLKDKFKTLLLSDGDYTMIALAPHFTFQCKIGMRRKFNECEFFDCNDFQRYTSNIGYHFHAERLEVQPGAEVTAAWSESGIILFFKDAIIANLFCSALRAGSLALVEQENRLFKDRGCCFINLQAAYKSRV